MKILCVCGFGVGSSMVLKMSLDKVCKQMNIDCTTETADINSVIGMPCDAIFTSAELAEQLRGSCKAPIYTLKRYMNLDEVKATFERFLKDTHRGQSQFQP